MAQETGYTTPDEMRAKALKRLALAGAVTAAALAALWWLDQGETGRMATRKTMPKPAPITAAAPAVVDPAIPGDVPAQVSVPPDGPVQTVPASASEAPPPPQVNNAPLAPPRAGGNPAPGAVQSPVLVGAFASQPATKPVLQTAGESFVVQVGVYHDSRTAQDMVRRLGKLGVKARLETRVQVGPFASKAEADKALETLRRQGFNGVVAVPEAISAASRR